MLSFLNMGTSSWYIVIAMILSGVGSGLFQSPNNSAVMGSVPAQHRGVASGTLSTMRNLGMVMGVAVSGALFSYSTNYANSIYSTQGLNGVNLSQAVSTYGLRITFTAAAIIALAAMVASLIKGKTTTVAEAKSNIPSNN